MKAVLYIRPDRFDMAELARRHPAHRFVRVDGAAEAEAEIADAEMLVTWTSAYDEAFAAMLKTKAPKLRWIQMTTSGVDSILRAGGFPEGVVVTNSAGLSAPMIAEHAIAMALMLAHRLRDYDAAFARRGWERDIKDRMMSFFRKTVCIVGVGAIGQETAKRLKPFGMKIIGVSRAYKPDDLFEEVYPRARLKEALARADVVLVSTIVTADTVDMINDETLAAMKKGAILVNIARGDLVDEDALYRALRDGHLTGAALDATKVEPLPAASPLWTLPNVAITPHISSGGADNSAVLLDIIDDNIRRFDAGRPLTRRVDWENMKLG
ncbi:MAG: hypothetical protein RL477_1337 [Pseudomonadota bacterium]|jgi:phosphoglycerate dehydrogenase-like enzyme